MEENQFQDIPQTFTPARPPKRLPKKTVVLIVFIVLVILSAILFRLLGKGNKQTVPTPTPFASPAETFSPLPTVSESPSPSPSSTPTPTPKPSINPVDSATGLDRSKLNVSVENGSGTAGVAGKAADYLKSLGYNVVSTGNADNFNYTNVFIQVKAADSDYLSLLEKDLGFNYTIGTTSADLSDSASEDALVIIGQ